MLCSAEGQGGNARGGVGERDHNMLFLGSARGHPMSSQWLRGPS